MKNRIIRLCYRKIIDANAPSTWDRYVFEDTYKEFLMQAQLYNQEKKYRTFAQLLAHVPGAEKLHFLVGSAAVNYVKQLNGIIPGVLNSLGKHFLPFEDFRFEIINSHIGDIERHQVAINFYSAPVRWLDSIGDQLLVALPHQPAPGELLTETFRLQPFLSIYSLQETQHD